MDIGLKGRGEGVLQVVRGAMLLLEDPDPQGRSLLVHLNGNLYDWVPFQPTNLKLIQAAGDATCRPFCGAFMLSLACVIWVIGMLSLAIML